MKRLFISSFILCALVVSCQDELQEKGYLTSPNALTGSFEEVDGSLLTKGSFNSSNKFVWNDTDQIVVLTSAGAATFEADAGGSSTTSFTGSVEPGALIGDKIAYPAQAINELTSNSVSLTLPSSYKYGDPFTYGQTTEDQLVLPCWAELEGNSFTMRHLGGYLVFQIQNIPAGVGRFEFRVTNGKRINGIFTADLTTDTPMIMEAEASTAAESVVTIGFNQSDETTTRCFYIPLPVGTYTYEWKLFIGTAVAAYEEMTTPLSIGRGKIKGKLETQDGEYNIGNHEYVDLGLPSGTLWATCNIGASSPEQIGNYYAWGEITTKATYSYSNYLSCYDGTIATDADCGTDKDPLKDFSYPNTTSGSIASTQYDAANMLWGKSWAIPTHEHMLEIVNSCNFTTETINGVDGCRITGPNGNSIFLPFTGYWQESSYRSPTGGYYWSANSHPSSANNAYRMKFVSNYKEEHYCGKFVGLPIRPVMVNDNGLIKLHTIAAKSVSYYSAIVGGILTSDGGNRILSSGICYSTTDEPTVDNNMITVPADKDGKMVYELTNLSCNTTYYFRPFAVNATGVYYGDVQSFTTLDDVYHGKHNGHEWVDLGLLKSHFDSSIVPGSGDDKRVVWATSNIGASSPEEYGYYFRWAEQQGWKIEGNTSMWKQYSNSGQVINSWNSTVFTDSYNPSIGPSIGYLDETIIYDFPGQTNQTSSNGYTYGDASTYNWGTGWYSMTSDIMYGLVSYNLIVPERRMTLVNGRASRTYGSGQYATTLDFEWTSVNGVRGLMVSNKARGTELFLPAAGSCMNSSVSNRNTVVEMWTVVKTSVWFAQGYMMNSTECVPVGTTQKYIGKSIRPILDLPFDASLLMPVGQIVSTPVISNVKTQNITDTTAEIVIEVSSDGGTPVSNIGMVYGTSADKLDHKSTAIVSGNTATIKLTGLTEGQLYFYKPFAINAQGESVGGVASFTTKGSAKATVRIPVGLKAEKVTKCTISGSAWGSKTFVKNVNAVVDDRIITVEIENGTIPAGKTVQAKIEFENTAYEVTLIIKKSNDYAFSNLNFTDLTTNGTVNGYAFQRITKDWGIAEKNIGASSSSDTGYYFRYGELGGWSVSGTPLSNSTCVQHVPAGSSLTVKTYSNSLNGTQTVTTSTSSLMNKVYSTYGDAAKFWWGNGWMLPDSAVLNESGVTKSSGYISNSTYNTRVYLPAAGYIAWADLNSKGSIRYYWSAASYNSSNGYELWFWTSRERFYALPVRPMVAL